MVRGAARGAWATVVMSTGFLIRPRVPPPPQVVAENLARRVGVEPESLPALVRHAYWPLAHLGFGTTLGALRQLLPGGRGGVLYGVAVFAVDYGVVLPLLGLYPRLDRDDRGRALANLASHALYGAAL